MEKWLDPQTIAIWIVIVLVFITLLAISFVKLVRINFKRMVENNLRESRMQLEHQKKLLETGIIAQEQERNRIAADLHDSLIGKLTVLRLKVQSHYSYEHIDLLLGESIDEARRISHDLSPPMLGFVELDEFLENILAPWRKYFKIWFYKNINPAVSLNQDIKIQIARIVQELIINIHKHAGATNAYISLKITHNCLILIVSDNGKGFDVTVGKKGIGLNNIELRMLYLKGVHKIKSGVNGSTAIIAINHKNFSN